MARRKHILLVDDDDELRLAVRILLEKTGYRVAEAAEGTEGIRKVVSAFRTGDPFDLLITDAEVGWMSGLEIIAGIRSAGAPVPDTVMTWSDLRDPPKHRATEEIREWLAKAFTPAELLAAVEAVFSRRRPSGESPET